ncbi:MAG TPA: choice-of-anchor D domain-containing protein, partial [Kofleriaceae bacterium]|nr:choice-of-anchor D domain-containing protein [Kofleriaceae bacterium]
MAKRGLVLSIAVVWLGSSAVAYATPQIDVSPGSCDFDHVDVGQSNGTRPITITNTGTTPLTVASAAVVDGAWFHVIGTIGPLTISAGGNYRAEVYCVPSAMGAQTGTFRVVSDANDQAGTATDVSLACFGNQGIVTVDPTTLDFGAVDVGSTKTLPLRVINTGNAAITSIALSLQNGVRGFTIDTSSLPLGIGPGEAVLLDATFTPVTTTSGGPLTVQVSARWHGTNTTAANLQLDGDGRHMSVQVSQATLAFGDFRFDDRPSRTFQIQNTGEDPIVVLAAQFVSDVGTTSGEYAFEITHGTTTLLQLPQTVYSTDHLDIKVIAQPSNRTGSIGGHVNIHTNIPGATDQRVTLTGNATAAGISAPATLDFGAVDLDGPEQTQTLTIRNAGDAMLDIQSITKQPDPADPESSNRFSLLLPVGASQLAPGAALSIDVTYRPTVQKHAGSLDALTLVATLTGALGGPAQAVIKLQGRGIDRTLVIDGAPVFPPTFRNPGDHAPVQPFPVHNSGDATLKVTGAMVIGGPVWQLLDPGPVEIPGGGTHDFQIRFSPTAIGPAPEGMLVLSDDDNLHPQVTVPLAGVGIARAVAFGPEVVDLGVVAIGSRTTIDELEATNLEPDAAFVIRTVTLSGSAALQLDDATAIALPAAASRPVAITFAPTVAGHFEATATLFLDQDEEAQAHVQIIGEAAPFRVTGGGCAAGGGVGGGAIVLLMAAGLAATRRRAAIALVVVALGARASADDVRVGAFDPTPETTGTGFQLASADVGRAGDWVASSVVSYATRLMTVTALVDGRAAEVVHPIAERSMLELGGAYAVRGRFEAGVRLPLYAQRGDPATGTTQLPPASGTALGDLTLHVKARVVQRGPLTAGAALHLT